MLFGKYCLLERVSVGGMAEVFRAKPFHVPQGRRYLALKRILPHLAENEEFIKMFIDEAKLTVQLRHPNIVQIYELGQFQSAYYILMEYIAGQDLLSLQKLARRDRSIMSEAQACFIIKELCRGMDYAHRKTDASGAPLNIIHRDISPQNVLVSYDGEVKVIDFGIAKAAVQSTHTQVGVLKGKFGYMSPEQVKGLVLDRRSDVFAIGVLFWELLTNRRLFKGENEFETLQMIRNPQIEAPSTRNPAIGSQVDRIVMRALAPDREQRYQWASELADDLERYLAELNPPYEQGFLAQWMEQSYAEDVATERSKHEQFRQINDPEDVRRLFAEAYGPGDQAPEESTGDATQIWDAEVAPVQGEDLNAFGANHTVVQAGGFDLEQYRREIAAIDPQLAYAQTYEAPRPNLSVPAGSAGPQKADTGFASSGTTPDAANPLVRPRMGGQVVLAGFSIVVLLALVAVLVYLLVGQGSREALGAGTVVVDVVPPTNLEIVFGGIPRGSQSPATIDRVIAGVHLLEVRHPDFETYQGTITVAANGLVPIQVSLEPRVNPVGQLTVSWPEDLEVALYVDGKIHAADESPARLEVPQGERLLELRSPNHRVWTQHVDVGAIGGARVEANLERIGRSLTLTGSDSGTVRVNGIDRGRLPVRVDNLSPTDLHTVEVGRWRTVVGLPVLTQGELEVGGSAQRHREQDYGWFTATAGQEWWRVYVNGVDTGLVTPIRVSQKVPLLAGKHQISFRRGRQSVDVDIEVGAGETVVVRENLTLEVR
jgi:eukaryotic-like serine/threonine-protein kinase